jgi:hypothetical protein
MLQCCNAQGRLFGVRVDFNASGSARECQPGGASVGVVAHSAAQD